MNATTHPKDLTPAPSSWNSWKTSEIAIVKAHYERIGPTGLLSMLPGRSYEAIAQRGRLLGLDAPSRAGHTPGVPRRSWAHLIDDHFDAVVRRMYHQPPRRGLVQETARALGVPRAVILARAVTLGIALPKSKEPPWTQAEERILEEHAHKVPVVVQRALAAAGFKRTASAIARRRQRLKLDTSDPDHLTARQLAQAMGVDGSTVAYWIDRHGLKASRRGTERTAAQGGDMYSIATKDFRRWMAANRQFIDLRKVDRHWFLGLVFDKEVS